MYSLNLSSELLNSIELIGFKSKYILKEAFDFYRFQFY